MQRIAYTFYKNKKYSIEQSQVDGLIWNENNKNILTCAYSIELLKWKEDYKELKALCIKEGKQTIATCLYGLSTYIGTKII